MIPQNIIMQSLTIKCFVTFRTKSNRMNGTDYLMCIRKHKDHKFLQHISGVDSKEVFQLVYRHEPADLKGKGSANISR